MRGRARALGNHWVLRGAGSLVSAILISNLPIIQHAAAQGPPEPEEILEERTATSRTFLDPDGSLRTDIFTTPIHYEQDGAWLPISSDLVPTSEPGYAWQNEANSFDVLFKDTLEPDYLHMKIGMDDLAFRLQSAAPVTGVRSDNHASRFTYEDAFSGVDLQYDVLPTGVKETLILADQTAPLHYLFVMTTKLNRPMEAQQRPDGSWAFYMIERAGPVFVLEAPFAVDASPEGTVRPGTHEDVTVTVKSFEELDLDGIEEPDEVVVPVPLPNPDTIVVSASGAFAIDLGINPLWLHDRSRQFPVRVDPTITLQPAQEDASFQATCPDCLPFAGDRLLIGTNNSVAWRGAVKFNLAGTPPVSTITSAKVKLHYDHWCLANATMCSGVSQQLDVHKMTGAWTTSSKTSQLQFNTTPISSFTLASPGATAQWMSWDITQTLKDWRLNTGTNHGLLFKRSAEPLGAGGPAPPGRRFSEPSITPKIEIIATGDAVDLLPPDTLHANGADLDWTRYTGPSGAPFQRYEVHRDASSSFTPSSTTLLATIKDINITSFRDSTAAPSKTFTYKVVANSSASIGQTVTLPADGQATKLLQPGPAEGKGVLYAFFQDTVNCANYGANDGLVVGNYTNATLRTALSFDLGDIPTAATISSATLSLWMHDPAEAALTVSVHPATRSWKEGTSVNGGAGPCPAEGATWYRSENSINWTSQGGDFDPTSVAQVSKVANQQPRWDNFTITPLVQKWVSGQIPNLGVILKAQTETLGARNDVVYYSDDHMVTFGLRPKLAVTYADGAHAVAPTVATSSPSGGEKVSGAVTVTAAASDDRRVASVQFLKDGASIGTDSSAPFSTTWSTTSADNGPHSLTTKATDDAGNVTTSSATSVTVQNSNPPTTSVTSPAGGSTVSSTATVTASASDDLGVDRVEFYFDGTRIGLPDTTSPYSVSWNTLEGSQPAFDGTHELTTRAYDTHGQMTASANTSVTVANTAGTKYRAGITATTPVPQAMVYDPADPTPDQHGVTLNVTNNSNVTFTTSDVVLRYRWFHPDGVPAVDSGNIQLPSNLAPGASATLTPMVVAPVLPPGVEKGEYKLRFDLYDNPSASYFGAKGNPPLDNPVIVNKAITAAALGLERYYHYEGEPVGAGMEHLTNLASGNSLLTWTPFSSPGRGLSTVVGLTYNSLEDHSESPVGANFSLSVSSLTRFGIPLDVHPNSADTLANPPRSNAYIEFTDGDGTTHRFTRNGTGGWDEPAGVHLYLREFSTTDPVRKWALTRPDRVTFFYDDEGYPTFVRDKNGNEIKFTLENTPPGEDPGGPKKRITQITDAAGLGGSPAPNRVFNVDYYSKAEAKKPQVRGNIEKITDHTGSVLLFEYYEDGNLLRITQKGGTNADGTALSDRSFVFTYTTSSGSGPAISTPANRVNPDPKTSNQSARLYSVRDPRGTETTFAYITSGQDKWKLQSRTNRTGNTTTFAYDFTNRRTTVTAPLSRVTVYAYDTEGKVTGITNPKNETTTLVWSADRHVTKVTEPTGAFTEFAYNNNGYLIDVWDELRNRTTLEYQNVAVDGNDVSSKWKAGRSIPHISQVIKKTNPRGTATATPTDDFQWSFGYDSNGNLTSVTEPEGSPRFTTTYAYNANGTLASITDARSNATTFNTYDANGLVTKVTDAKNQITQFGYDDDGLLRFVQDPLHAAYTGGDPRTYRTYFDYDSFHRLGRDSTPKLSSVSPVKLVWTAVAYDPNDNVLSEFAGRIEEQFVKGPETKLTYDPMDRILTSTNPDAEKTGYAYDAGGRLLSLTTPKGTATTGTNQDFAEFYEYDPVDRVIRETRYGTGGAVTPFITHFCYDLAGDLRSVTSPRASVATVNCSALPGFTTSYEYDAAHRLTKESDPLNHATRYGYDADGNITTTTNPSNDVTTRTFDQRGLLAKVVEPFSATRDITTMYRYDGVGNLAKLISPRAFDASPDQVNFTEFVTTYGYDAVNQLTTVELPSRATETKSYLHRTYDANGNMVLSTLPDPSSTPGGVAADSKITMTYFDTGWVESTKDPSTLKVFYDYDGRGQQTFRRLGTFNAETWEYAPDGMLLKHTDRGNQQGVQQITYDYDDNNNLSKVTDTQGVNTPGVKPIEVVVLYDTLDRMTKVRNRNLGDTDTNYRFTRFSYDKNDNVAERADNGVETEGGTQVTAPKRHVFTYDAADWLTTQLDYLPSGCLKVQNTFLPTGWEETRKIWKVNEPCDASPAFGSTPRQSTKWTYFKNGKLNTLTTRGGEVDTGPVLEEHIVGYVEGGVDYVNGHRTTDSFRKKGPNSSCNLALCTITYQYDGRERVTREQRSSGPAIDYTLDAAGNLTKKVFTPPSGSGSPTTTFFTYMKQRLEKVAVGTATNFVQRYIYDEADEGNVDCVVVASYSGTKCEGATPSQILKDYHYDHLNRIDSYVSYQGGAEQDRATYVYDPLDRLLQETEKHGSSPTRTTDFSYLGLTNLVTQETQTGDPTKDATKSYSYDAFGHRISLRNAPVTGTTKNYLYSYDVHGSVGLLTEVATGTAEATYGYDAYGEKDTDLSVGDPEDNNPLNPFRYSGKRFDSGSKTLDMGARRFDSAISRFLTPDMFLGALDNLSLSTDPLTGNRYALAGGNPVTFEEWDGHVALAEGGGTASTSPNPAGAVYASTGAREGTSDRISAHPKTVGMLPSSTTAAREGGLTAKLLADRLLNASSAQTREGNVSRNQVFSATLGPSGRCDCVVDDPFTLDILLIGVGGVTAGIRGTISVARAGIRSAVRRIAARGSAASRELPAASTVPRSPSFVAHPSGVVIVPRGATGPFSVRTGRGFQFTGGQGGFGLNRRVTDVRIMDPVIGGKYPSPGGYVSYMNRFGQPVNPWTGRTISRTDPYWHWQFGSPGT